MFTQILHPNFTFAFAFVILKVINSEIMWFRFALISVSMVTRDTCSDSIGKLSVVLACRVPQEEVGKGSSIICSFLVTFWSLFLTLLALFWSLLLRLLLLHSFCGRVTIFIGYRTTIAG